MQGFGGSLQVDGYAGYNRLITQGRIGHGIQLDYCWAHAVCRLVARQKRSAIILACIDNSLRYHRARASAKSPLGEALACIAKYPDGLGRFLTDGRIEIDNNTVERTIRPIALNRKNALLAGHDDGAANRVADRNLKDERGRSTCLAGQHAQGNRQRAPAKPDRRSATVQLCH